MDSKVCVICNTEKSIDNFYNKYRECKQYSLKRNLKRYNENNDKISNQQKLYYEKKDKPLQKQNIRLIEDKELLRSYIALENRLKAMEEKFTRKDSESNKK